MTGGVPASLLLEKGNDALGQYLEERPESARRIQNEMSGVSLLRPGQKDNTVSSPSGVPASLLLEKGNDALGQYLEERPESARRIQNEMSGVSLLRPGQKDNTLVINDETASMQIQGAIRGRNIRKELGDMRRHAVAHEQASAARGIQAGVRARSTRDHVSMLHEAATLDRERSMKEIQSAMRGKLAREDVSIMLVREGEIRNEIRNERVQVTILQVFTMMLKGMGGMALRRWHMNTLDWLHEVDVAARNQGARVLQSGVRGYAGRSESASISASARNQGAMVLQSGVRGYDSRAEMSGKREFLHINKSAATVQAGIVGRRVRQRVLNELEVQEAAERSDNLQKYTALLSSSKLTVRMAAAAAIADMSRNNRPRVEALANERKTQREIDRTASLLLNPSWTIRMAAVAAMENMGNEARDYTVEVAKLLNDEHRAVREAARETLRKIAPADTGEVYIDNILRVKTTEHAEGLKKQFNMRSVLSDLEDTRWGVRKSALEGLIHMSDRGTGYAKIVAALLEDHHIAVRQAAVNALHVMSPFLSQDIVDDVTDRLSHHQQAVRRGAVLALGSMALKDRHIRALESMLNDKYYSVADAAKVVLHELPRKRDSPKLPEMPRRSEVPSKMMLMHKALQRPGLIDEHEKDELKYDVYGPPRRQNNVMRIQDEVRSVSLLSNSLRTR